MLRWAALAFLLTASATAQKVAEMPMTVEQFGGENTFIDSARLPPNSAQSAVNVITERGFLEKRTGAVRAITFPAAVYNLAEFVKSNGSRVLLGHSGANVLSTDLGATPAVLSTVSATGNVDFAVAFNKAIFVDGTQEVEYDGTSTTTSSGFPAGCKYIEFDKVRIWCANMTESQSAVRVSSYGSIGYFTVPNNVNLIPDAPNLFYISRDDGQAITCMKKTPWGIVVGKRRSLWVIKGFDNTNWYVLNVDPTIGCTDDRTMQMGDGRLRFLGVDGVYSWDGAGPLKLESRDIESTILTIRQASAQTQSWAVDQKTDFDAGNLTVSGPGAPISSTILNGSITPSSWTAVDTSSADFSAGTLGGLTTVYIDGSIQLSSAAYLIYNGAFDTGALSPFTCRASVGNGSCAITTCSGSNCGLVNSSYDTATPCSGGDLRLIGTCNGEAQAAGSCNLGISPTLHIYNSSLSAELYSGTATGSLDLVALGLSTQTLRASFRQQTYINSGISPIVAAYELVSSTFSGFNFSYDYASNISGLVYNCCVTEGCAGVGDTQVSNTTSTLTVDNIKASRYFGIHDSSATPITFYSQVFNTGLSTPVAGPFTVSSSVPAGTALTYQTRASSTSTGSWSAWSTVAADARATFARQYVQYLSTFTTNVATSSPRMDSATLAAVTTGYYRSDVHFVGSDISSWGGFDETSTIPIGSTITYRVRIGTYAFAGTNPDIAWVTQQPDQAVNLAVSTPTYVQWEALFSAPSSTASPSLELIRSNWNTGQAVTPAASAFHKHRYWLCVAISSSINDLCLIQQRTGDWVEHRGQSIGALTLYNADLMGGDATSRGYAWRMMQDGVYNDDGAAIDAYWISPDYLFGNPVSQKVLNEIWIDAMPSSGTLLSVGYAVDRTSSSYATRTMDLGTSTTAINRKLPITAGFVAAKYLRMRIGNAQNDKYFRANAFTLFGTAKEKID